MRNTKQRFGRKIIIHICADGTFTHRRKGEPTFNGAALPVFSVDTIEEVEKIRVMTCVLQHGEHPLLPGQPWYAIRPFGGELEDLYEAGDKIEAAFMKLKREPYTNETK